MATNQTSQDDNFKRYIRDTLYFDMGKPARPFIKLRGKYANYIYRLQPETEELFGWKLYQANKLVRRDENGKIISYGWRCAGWAVSDDLCYTLADAGLERWFFLNWGSDQRIFTRTMRGPAVDVKTTTVNCYFSIQYRSATLDWQKLDDGMERLHVLVKLKAPL